MIGTQNLYFPFQMFLKLQFHGRCLTSSAVVRRVKLLLPAALASHRTLIQVPTASLLTQLPANAPGEATEDGSGVRAPTRTWGDPDEAPDS